MCDHDHSSSTGGDDEYAPHLNVDRLRQTSGDDNAFEEMLLDSFLETYEEQMTTLEAALEDSNQSQIYFTAHTLKGTLLQLGGDASATVTKEVLSNVGHVDHAGPASTEQFTAAKALFPQLRTQCDTFVDTYRRYLADHKAAVAAAAAASDGDDEA